jgi:hypothetical protein
MAVQRRGVRVEADRHPGGSERTGRVAALAGSPFAKLLLGLAFGVLAGCGGSAGDSLQGSVLCAVNADVQHPGARPPLAGMSARAPLDLAPIDRKRLGGDTLSHEFIRYMHRCLSCHAAPDPAIHGYDRWVHVVQRMNGNMAAAGLLPLGDEDRAAVLLFLEKHARMEEPSHSAPGNRSR